MRGFMERWRDWRGARLARHPYVVATVALERDRAYRDGQQNPPTEVVLARVDLVGHQDEAYQRGARHATAEVRRAVRGINLTEATPYFNAARAKDPQADYDRSPYRLGIAEAADRIAAAPESRRKEPFVEDVGEHGGA